MPQRLLIDGPEGPNSSAQRQIYYNPMKCCLHLEVDIFFARGNSFTVLHNTALTQMGTQIVSGVRLKLQLPFLQSLDLTNL